MKQVNVPVNSSVIMRADNEDYFRIFFMISQSNVNEKIAHDFSAYKNINEDVM